MFNIFHLWQVALNARNQAYAPYSGFKVGAVVLDRRGNIYTGCNVENVSYPCGTCAEAGAISAMVADGGRRIDKMIIVADGTRPIMPCGACLQRILEFSDADTLVYTANLTEVGQSFRLAELLPMAFKEETLRHD